MELSKWNEGAKRLLLVSLICVTKPKQCLDVLAMSETFSLLGLWCLQIVYIDERKGHQFEELVECYKM